MPNQLSTDDCKKILFNIGIKLGVSPRLISERLLSKEDKTDMLNGNISVESLMTAVKSWMSTGMPDYANGHTTPYKASNTESAPLHRLYAERKPYSKFKR